MDRQLLIFCSILFVLTACHKAESVHIVADHWAVGDTTWFEVIHSDSVFSADTSYLQRKSYKAVRLAVLSMEPTPRLEWQEFMLDSIVDSSAIMAIHKYWYPAMRIEYSCNLEGGIKDIVNFPELHAYMDTMTQRYLDQLPTISDDQRKLVRDVYLDSTWIMSRAMNDVALLHQCYGYNLSSEADHGRLTAHDLEIGDVGYTTSLSNDPLCQEPGIIGIQGAMKADSASTGGLLRNIKALSPYADSIGDSYTTANIKFTICFNQSISLPSYVTQILDAEFLGRRVQKTATIYINQNWNVPIQ